MENKGKYKTKFELGVWKDLKVYFTNNSKNWKAQKLRTYILIQSGLVNWNFRVPNIDQYPFFQFMGPVEMSLSTN